ncbi:hypothetical protein OOZ63_00875 [Paucibacter sp. PLA-PC-4]|uniref:DUF6968 family protein n=1 Tax=Paucibacter sp. PLA-PC-4 TaxID=2993655 RepID=UPI00224887A0|nr:hypothetical protein [Paucibacter sp. PLA-PC-4]MCX2860391.1 hypothetical protein [Paucibacter sp. PLA-PC-4]
MSTDLLFFEKHSVMLRTVVMSDAAQDPKPLAVRIWLKPALASGDAECAMQIDGLMREPITFAGIDSMHALEIAMSAADSHLVYASRAKNLKHRWGQPYHSTSSWGPRPLPPAPPSEAIAHT